MMRLLLALLCTALLAPAAGAHELRPAYLQISEREANMFDVSWRVPARGDRRLALNPRFGDGVTQLTPPAGQLANGYHTASWQVRSERGLADSRITIAGLEQTLTDVLAHITWLDGREQMVRVLPDQPQFVVAGKAGNGQIAVTYFKLGVEHILLGIDHLLFVLALVLLANGGKRLVGTVTAFTLAHSITLAAAVLGLVSVPQAPVEAIIALSILFVAGEILSRHRGHSTLSIRRPWLVAFSFGLLHGLGFAGALAEIGVPQHAIPLSLAMFNIGVEAGQLLFIGALAALVALVRALPAVQSWQLRSGYSAGAMVALPLAYLIGSVATWWLIERTVSMAI